MKRLLFLLASLSILLVSCSKDDDDSGLGNFDYDVELLFGTWEITHAMGIPWFEKKTTATFYSDGTYSGRGYFGNGTGTYKLSSKTITCYIDGEKFMWYEVVSLEGTKCTLVAFDNSGSLNIQCKKL